MPRRLVPMIVALLVLLGPGTFVRSTLADDRVDLLLVLAADISRSVDDRKFRLQREGYAAAITDPRVVRAMAGGPTRRIAICFMEWAGDTDQAVVMDWTQRRQRRGGGGCRQAHPRRAARLHGAHVDQRRHRLQPRSDGAQPLSVGPAGDRRVGRRHQQLGPARHRGARRRGGAGCHHQRAGHPERDPAGHQSHAHASAGRADAAITRRT